MKLYGKSREGFSPLIGYECDNKDCKLQVFEEDIPKGWIEESGGHYCTDCQIECYFCHKVYSIEYLEYWMTEGLCEDCFTNLKEEKNETI